MRSRVARTIAGTSGTAGFLDWAQLITHVIGFLIALAILKRYAWGPILGMIEERQKTIRTEMDEASKARQDMEGLRDDLEKRLREIDAEGREKAWGSGFRRGYAGTGAGGGREHGHHQAGAAAHFERIIAAPDGV